MIVPFLASIFIVRKLVAAGLTWQSGIPLCFMTGIVALSLIILTFYEPSNPALRVLSVAYTTEMAGYALIPAAVVYFLWNWNSLCNAISPVLMKISMSIAVVGATFFAYLIWNIVTYVPPEIPQRYDVFQFSESSLIFLAGSLIYGVFLLPVIGIVFLSLGHTCWNVAAGDGKDQVTPP